MEGVQVLGQTEAHDRAKKNYFWGCPPHPPPSSFRGSDEQALHQWQIQSLE